MVGERERERERERETSHMKKVNKRRLGGKGRMKGTLKEITGQLT